MKKLISLFAKAFTIGLTAVLLLALALNFSTLLSVNAIKRGKSVKWGYFCVIVGSGSMEPTVLVNDLLFIKAGDSYKPGDIVTFVSPGGALVTHRVKKVLDKGYITQGDRNNIPDEEISEQRVLGKAAFIIPGVGGIVNGILSPFGMIFSGAAILLLWLIKRIKNEKDVLEK